MEARAVVTTSIGKVEFTPVTVPVPTPEDVVIQITHSWISNGTEGSMIRGERIAGDTPRSDSDPMPFPHVPGYQKTGIVEWVGKNVMDIHIGDLVFATVSPVNDMFYSHGGHVSPAVTHHSQVWKLPPDTDPVAVSGLVLTQVGYNVGMRPTISAGESAVVLGDGLVGHWAAQTLQARGVKTLMIGKHQERLEKFQPVSGDAILNLRTNDMVDGVRKWSPQGIKLIADTVGSIPSMEALIPLCVHDSHISSAGFYGANGHIDIQKLRDREMTLHAPSGWSKERMDATLDMILNGKLHTLPLITHHFPVFQAEEAYNMILQHNQPHLGVILDWE